MLRLPLAAAACGLLSVHALAQVPAPNPLPRIAPRAEWVATANVVGTPPNRHWSQPANSDTQMFVFGGRTGTSGSGSRRNDLWVFDAPTLTWTELSTDGDPTAPPQRFLNACTYDPQLNRVLVFGGQDAGGNYLGDTWQFDLNTNAWSQINTPGPSARRHTRLASDPSSGGVLLFGGQDASGIELGDTWLLIGNVWNPISPSAAPPARGLHHMVTRPDFSDILLCGGRDYAATGRIHFTDVWSWDATSPTGWTQIPALTTAIPHGVFGNNAVYDPLRQRLILHGGQGISTSATPTGGAYGTLYGGSPSNWTSEFDCVTNEWKLYGDTNFNTGDPVVGRGSRYYAAFLQPGNTVYMWGGQNPSGSGIPLTSVKEYQADPIATASIVGSGCSGSSGSTVTATPTDLPWLGRGATAEITGLESASLLLGLVGVADTSIPLSVLIPGGLPGCTLDTRIIIEVPMTNFGGNSRLQFGLPANATFAGLTIQTQVIQVEVNGPQLLLSSSNAISLSAGLL